MVQIDTKIQNKKNPLLYPPRTYNEIIHYLDTHWSPTTNLIPISQLDEHFNFPSKELTIAMVSGTSGKSTTIHYLSKLLEKENIKTGAFYTPHVHSYNERFLVDNQQISNKNFTDIANAVIEAVEYKKIAASTKDILTMMAILFFKEQSVNVAVFENSGTYNLDPVLYCHVDIAAITRIVQNTAQDDIHAAVSNIIVPLTSDSHVVAADQTKQTLQIIQKFVESKGSTWSMPIRKVAPLAYPFEQLHGRCAALAERVAHIYIDHFLYKDKKSILEPSLLNKPKGLRGRPTLEAKKVAQSYPKKSLEEFWSESTTTLPWRFELINEKKQPLLLDNADNLDALQNLFLGFRLLSYKKSFKGVSIILGCYENQFDDQDFIKQVRYFIKKISGSIALCPIQPKVGEKSKRSWDVQKIAYLAKAAKIKSRVFKNFNEAFKTLTSMPDDNNLIVITGSQAILSEYIDYKNQVTAHI